MEKWKITRYMETDNCNPYSKTWKRQYRSKNYWCLQNHGMYYKQHKIKEHYPKNYIFTDGSCSGETVML